MKRAITLGIGALALGAMTLPTSAADLGARPITKAPISAPVAIYNWSGFYIGGHIGGSWGDKDWSIVPGVAGAPLGIFLPVAGAFDIGSHQTSGFLAGGQIGLNLQAGAGVFGIGGQASGAKCDGSPPDGIGIIL